MSSPLFRLGSSLLLFLAAAAAGASGGCSADETHATPAPIAAPDVPPALQVPQGNAVVLKAIATGTQIYACQAAADNPAAYTWTFKAPSAVLSDAKGTKIGKHYAGPTWESNDASKVVGAVDQKADAPNASAIPWLLLHKTQAEGAGVFGKVTFVQRVNTVGGKAPTTGCDAGHVGEESAIDYTADYYFYAPH